MYEESIGHGTELYAAALIDEEPNCLASVDLFDVAHL